MYFPESQIITNLYTNGGELIYLSSKQDYNGYYFKTLSGKYYTGKNQNDGPNEELILFTPQTQPSVLPNTFVPQTNYVTVLGYSNDDVLDIPSPTKLLPYYLPESPTQTSYQVGEFRRYFCKKTNQIQYTEINKTQFDLLVQKSPQIEFSLYYPFFLDWQLTGDKSKVAEVNRNSTLLAIKNQKLPKLDEYLQYNWTKYYQ